MWMSSVCARTSSFNKPVGSCTASPQLTSPPLLVLSCRPFAILCGCGCRRAAGRQAPLVRVFRAAHFRASSMQFPPARHPTLSAVRVRARARVLVHCRERPRSAALTSLLTLHSPLSARLLSKPIHSRSRRFLMRIQVLCLQCIQMSKSERAPSRRPRVSMPITAAFTPHPRKLPPFSDISCRPTRHSAQYQHVQMSRMECLFPECAFCSC